MPPRRNRNRGRNTRRNQQQEKEHQMDELLKELSLRSLNARFKDSHDKLETQRTNRNYYQLERDAYQTFYEIVRKEVADLELKVKKVDIEKQNNESNHRSELRTYVYKVKYLENQHVNDKERCRRSGISQLNEAKDEQEQTSMNLRAGKLQLKLELKERELTNQQEIKEQKEKHSRALALMREEFEEKLITLKQKYATKLDALKDDLELRRKVEIHEIEERKNQHINELYAHHSHAYGQMKDYYNSITRNNLELITSLNNARTLMKEKQVVDTEEMLKMDQLNKKLSEPLAKTTSEKNELIHELKGYAKDQLSLQNATARLKLLKRRHERLREKHAQMGKRYNQVEKERDDLFQNFDSVIWQVRKKSQFKNHMLEQKLNALSESASAKQAQLGEVMKYANLDPTRTEVLSKIAKSVVDHNDAIKKLQYEVARATKSHNDVVRTLRGRLSKLGVPMADLNQVKLMNTHTTSAPASLVAATSL